MKILLMGEYSGFFSNLKIGFEKLGHCVDFYHDGDGEKKFGGEHNELMTATNNKVKQFIHIYRITSRLKEYDLVLLINPSFMGAIYSKMIFNNLRKNNSIIYISSCGDFSYLLDTVKKKEFKYYAFDDDHSLKYPKLITDYERPIKGKLLHYIDKYILDHCNKIVPTAYEYYYPIRDKKNLVDCIPLPIEIPETEPKFDVGDKVVVYYGLNKPFFKGAAYIEPALKRLQNEYPTMVEVIIKDRVPYAEYQKIIDSADIIVDQCKSYGWGMNAVISMINGKVVLSGAERETLQSYGLEEVPIVNIIPDEEQIYNQLKKLIMERENLQELKKRSYLFAREFHNCKKIAEKYIELMEENTNDNA